jgi:hypothetical protein
MRPVLRPRVGSGPLGRRVLLTLGLAASLGLADCGPGALSGAPSARCTEPGAQCQLAEGPLGVCERADCAPGATPPCFRCVAQH